MVISDKNDTVVPAANVAGNAGGVPQKHWFVAKLRRNNTEKATEKTVNKLGIETYIASQQETRIWKNGKRAKIDRIIIPSTLFIRCTEKERRMLVTLPQISHFLTNRAAKPDNGLNAPIATVSEHELENLRFMLGASDVNVSFTTNYIKGQEVKVVRGPLKGLIGIIARDSDNTNRLFISVSILGSASIQIEPLDVEPI